MKILDRLKNIKLPDIRDVFVFGGLGILGWGLYLKWGQWLAFMVCGAVLMFIGYLTGDK